MKQPPVVLLAALGAAALLGACSAALPQPVAVDLVRAQRRWSDVSLSELSKGRSLLTQKCAGCHALPLPSDRSPERWPAEVARMRSSLHVSLSDAEAGSITRYLVTMSE